MIEITGELFDAKTTYIAITTNGTIKRNGECVMGRGCALEAKVRYPQLPKILGDSLKSNGNHVIGLLYVPNNQQIVAFPVKHNWWEQADIALIERSCKELLVHVDQHETCALPRAGCGNGKLSWQVVKPIMARYLDDRFMVYHK